MEAETLPAVGITSKWLQVEEEEDDSTAVKEQVRLAMCDHLLQYS